MITARILLFIVALHLNGILALAYDSPLSSSYFATAYRDHAEVDRIVRLVAEEHRVVTLDSTIGSFLLQEEIDLGVRLAAVNALGYGQKIHIDVMLQCIAKRYGGDLAGFQKKAAEEHWSALSTEFVRLGVGSTELMVVAYVWAMADFESPKLALPLLLSAQADLQLHEAGYWAAQLIASQMIMESQPCKVFVMFAELEKRTFNQSPMRREAKLMILDYIALYELACLPDQYSDDYYRMRPVFDTTQTKQPYSPAKYVDLLFVGQVDGELAMSVFTDNQNEDGGYVLLEIKNNGNIHSIPTNVYCEMHIKVEGGQDRLVRQALVPGIPPRRSEMVTIFLPGLWWQSGAGTMELTVDQAAQIAESNEENNAVRMGQ